MKRLTAIQNELIKASQAWASGGKGELARAKELRDEAIRLNHAHYCEDIPVYRELAQEGCGEDVDVATIKEKLMFSADIFKSYEQAWLDDGDFSRMTRWLSSIYHRRIELDVSGVKSIDDWIERLGSDGVHVVYSSGTSGAFSFVPRDRQDWELSKTANIACLAPLLARRMVGSVLSRRLLKSAIGLMPPDAFARLAGKKGLPDFDAFFLAFRQGSMGNQVLIEELAPLFRRHYFLYDIDITGTALRCLRRGARTNEERQLLAKFQDEIIGQRETNYLKLIDNIRKSTDEGQKVFIFGAPYQFKELCEVMTGHNRRLALKKGSLVLFGGGWKSFRGEAIGRETLVGMLADALDISPEMILEGYSMTEINVLTLRCEHGRFHIPPIIEPVIFNEELDPLEGRDVMGAFGFLDPLAVAYPGFIISGDYVRMIDGECECGLVGPAIAEIGRMPGSEIKGCGGIMGSIRA